MSLTAIYSEGLEFPFPKEKNLGTVKDAFNAAHAELKRKVPDAGDVSLPFVLHKVDGSLQPKKVKLEDKMKSDYVLQLQSESKLLDEKIALQRDKDCILLEPEVINFASLVMGRLISGSAQTSDERKERAKAFMEEDKEGKALLSQLANTLGTEWTAEDIAGFADDNYWKRNKLAHNTTDSALRKRADRLKRVGAVELLREDFAFQCRLIEKIDEVLKWLPAGVQSSPAR